MRRSLLVLPAHIPAASVRLPSDVHVCLSSFTPVLVVSVILYVTGSSTLNLPLQPQPRGAVRCRPEKGLCSGRGVSRQSGRRWLGPHVLLLRLCGPVSCPPRAPGVWLGVTAHSPLQAQGQVMQTPLGLLGEVTPRCSFPRSGRPQQLWANGAGGCSGHSVLPAHVVLPGTRPQAGLGTWR